MLPLQTERQRCDIQTSDRAEFYELSSQVPIINHAWHTPGIPQSNFMRGSFPTFQPMEQMLSPGHYGGEDYIHSELLEPVNDVEETMQQYIERIELEAMLNDEQEFHNPEEAASIDEEDEHGSKCMTSNMQTALPGGGLDEALLCHSTTSALGPSVELQGRSRDWQGLNRLEWFDQEPRHQERSAYNNEHVQYDNAELEMTSFWRPNRFM